MMKTPILFILSYVLFRLFFLPIEHTGDGWGYACEILKGDFFSPHHILYKPLMFGILKFIQTLGFQPNPIQLFSAINLIVGGGCLAMFYSILNLWGNSKTLNLWLLILVSFTFGFIRYSGENETYILPLFFSLVGTYFWKRKNFWYSILFMCLAVIFHQIHIFWLLAFFVPLKKNKIHFKYILFSALFLIGFYIVYAEIYNKNWYLLPFSDVQSGLVEVVPGFMNFIMTPLSFMRTFFQLHGNMVNIFLEFPYAILCWLSLALIVVLIFFNRHEINWIARRILTLIKRLFSTLNQPLGLAFALQLLFAFYSVGNAEFMVMLPFLLILWQYENIALIPLKLTHSLAVILGLWNFTFWIVPSKYMEFDQFNLKQQKISSFIVQHQLQDSTNVFVGSNHVVFNNFWEYQNLNRQIQHRNNFQLEFLSVEEFKLEKNKTGKSYFTDEASNSKGLNRKSITSNIPQKSNDLWQGFKKLSPEIQVLSETKITN